MEKKSVSKIIDRIISGTSRRQLGLLLICFLFFLVVGWGLAILLHVDKPNSGNKLGEAFWWTFIHISDPGFMDNETSADFGTRLLSAFLTFSGLFILGGLLVAVLVGAYENRINSIRMGLSRYSFKGKHGIILGWNPMGVANARQMFSDGCKEVVILALKDIQEIKSHLFSAWGDQRRKDLKKIYVLNGTFDSLSELKLLSPWSSVKVVILGDPEVRGSDSRNIQAAMRIAEMIHKNSMKRDGRLPCYVNISNLGTYDLLQEIDLSKEDKKIMDFRPFNFFEEWARRIWGTYQDDVNNGYSPLAYRPISKDSRRSVSVAIAGFGQMGQAMAIQAARLAHYANAGHEQTEIIVFDPEVDHRKKEFLSHYHLEEGDRLPGVRFLFKPILAESQEAREILCERASDDRHLLSVAICISDPDCAMAAAMALPPDVLIPKIPILVWQEVSTGLPEMTRRIKQQTNEPIDTQQAGKRITKTDTRWNDIRFFGTLSECFTNDRLQEELAKAIHQSYLDLMDSKGWLNPEKPSQRPWEELSEKYRWANRYQADACFERLVANGFKAVPADGPEAVNAVTEFEPEVVESMAIQEHDRWWVERTLAGWKFAEKRDDLRLKHNNLVPYDQLDVDTQEFDRNAIRNMIKHLKDIYGLIIVKEVRGQQ